MIAGSGSDEHVQAMVEFLGNCFLPTTTVLFSDTDNLNRIAERLPDIAVYQPVNGKASAYLCESYACQQPISQLAELKERVQ